MGSKIYYETSYGPLLAMQGFLNEITLDLQTPKGLLPVLISSAHVKDESGSVLLIKSTLFDISERRKYERELLVAKRKAERATIRATFLARAGEKLRNGDELEKQLQDITEIALNELCDAFAIDLLITDKWKRVAEAHRISEKAIPKTPLLNEPILIEDPTDLESNLEFTEIINQLEPQSIIIVPIMRNQKQLGAISLYLTELGRRFFPEDKTAAIELAFEICSTMEKSELQKELQETHEWFSMTLQSIGDAVIAINPDKTVSYLNPVAEELTGWTNREAKGQPMAKVFNIINEFTRAPAFNPVDTVLKEKRIVGLANGTVLIRRDGGEIIIEDSASPIQDNKGVMRGVVLVFRDVTEKHLEETKKNQMLSVLSSEKEVREKFVATLTHDMRSPLTSVKMNMQLLARKSTEPHTVTLANRAVSGVNRIDRMIQELLDANRLRAGETIPMDKSEMDIAALGREVLADLTLIHGDRFILVSPESLIGIWNSEGIRRVLENLCNNAIKYGTPDAPVDISIQQKNDEVHITVHNEGKPISIEDQRTLFELYKRIESDENKSQKGWGLGLTLVKGVTESHQGRIQVHSEAKSGTTFEVILPIIST